MRAALLEFAARFRRSDQRPQQPQQHGDASEGGHAPAPYRHQPEPDMLPAEWTAFQALIREIHKSDKEHQTAEQNLGKAQHRTAQSLNWVTGIGAIFGLVGSVGIIGSLIVAKEAADDARDALHTSQRPWIIAEGVELSRPIDYGYRLCRIGYRVLVKNTGNSVATAVAIDSRAVSGDGGGAKTFDVLKDEIKRLWIKQDGRLTGIVLAPGQTVSPLRCPWYGDGADPDAQQAAAGGFALIGYIQYVDQYGLTHHTQFEFIPDGDSIRPWDGKTFVIANINGEAD